MKSPLHAQCPPSVTFLVILNYVGTDLVHLCCWIRRISCWFHLSCSKSKLVCRKKARYNSKVQRGRGRPGRRPLISVRFVFSQVLGDCSLFSHFQPCLKFIDLDCTGMLSLCCSLYCGAALLRKCETTKYTRHLSRI